MSMEQMTLFDNNRVTTPLASRLRPSSLDDFVGQEHLFGEKGVYIGVHVDDYKIYGKCPGRSPRIIAGAEIRTKRKSCSSCNFLQELQLHML